MRTKTPSSKSALLLQVSKPRTHALVRAMPKQHTSVYAVPIHHILPMATDCTWQNCKLTDTGWTNILPSIHNPWHQDADDMTMQTLCLTFVLTPAMKVALVPSMEQPQTNLAYVIRSTNAYV